MSEAELQRVFFEGVRDLVQLGLQGEERGQRSLAAQGGGAVGEGGLAEEAQVWDVVERESLARRGPQKERALRGVGSHVRENVEIEGDELPLADPHPDAHPLGGTRRGDGQLLLPREDEARRPPGAQGDERAQVFRDHVGLPAETSPHLGLDHQDAGGGDPQGLGEGLPHPEGRLGGGPHHEPAVLVEPGDRMMGLEGRGRGGGHEEGGLEHAHVARQGTVDVAQGGLHPGGQVGRVAGGRGLDQGSVGAKRPLGIEDGRARLVLDANRVRRSMGQLRVLGRHHRDPVAHELHRFLEGQPPARGGRKRRRVLVGEHRHHPGQGPPRGGVDPRHPGVGMGRADHPQVQLAGDAEVAREGAVAGDVLDAHPRRAAASTARTGFA